MKKCDQSRQYYQIEKVFDEWVKQKRIPRPLAGLDIDTGHENEDEDLEAVFKAWAGVKPDTFLWLLSPIFKNKESSSVPDLFENAHDGGHTKTPRIFDRFFNIVRMISYDQKYDANPLVIRFSVQESPFGRLMVASTDKGVCRVSFLPENENPGGKLQSEFKEAKICSDETSVHKELAESIWSKDSPKDPFDLHLKGTPFQVSVWEALLRIPEGELRCCSDLAKEINNPKALRAVGSAVGSNPIAFFIPCHRIVPAAGGVGNYRWGIPRKAAMIGWERVRVS